MNLKIGWSRMYKDNPEDVQDCLLFVRKQNKTQLKNLILKNNEKDFGFHQERLGVDSH